MLPPVDEIVIARHLWQCRIRALALAALLAGFFLLATSILSFWMVLVLGLVTPFMPSALPASPILLASAVILLRMDRTLARWIVPMPKSECPRCGYPLTGIGATACPECGGPVPRGPGGGAERHHGS